MCTLARTELVGHQHDLPLLRWFTGTWPGRYSASCITSKMLHRISTVTGGCCLGTKQKCQLSWRFLELTLCIAWFTLQEQTKKRPLEPTGRGKGGSHKNLDSRSLFRAFLFFCTCPLFLRSPSLSPSIGMWMLNCLQCYW